MTPEEFKQKRIEMGLSQQKMADFLGLKAVRTVRYYESGGIPISGPVIKILEMNEELLELKPQLDSLQTWMNNTWFAKSTPPIDSTVLIHHNLGAGGNHDVACYLGKNNYGDDRYLLNQGTVIFKHHTLKWRYLDNE